MPIVKLSAACLCLQPESKLLLVIEDWRQGADWFESFLVDYDVASNWGTWPDLATTQCIQWWKWLTCMEITQLMQ